MTRRGRFLTAFLSAALTAASGTIPHPALARQIEASSGPPVLKVDAAHPGARFSPMFYGLMTEEINYSYDGGLYGELIRNRIFNDPATGSNGGPSLAHWSRVQTGGGIGAISLDFGQTLNDTLTPCLKLAVGFAGKRVGVANAGYWGIPIRPATTYRASFWAKAAPGFNGPLDVALENNDGQIVYARATTSKITTGWARYSVILKTAGSGVTPTANARFVISAHSAGTLWLNLVSLFPPTYKNRPNGNRPDLMEKLAGLHPAFLRLPGGNYLEGDSVATRFDWKKTLGPLEKRTGHPGPWGYRSTDGMGLLEFLLWCEDLHMEPVLAVYAGYSLKGEHVQPGADLKPYVQDALDEIEYLIGDAKTTKWGARRAADGHPAPFPLTYVEVGNEDWFDRSQSYNLRYAQFHDAIKARFPHLKLIATAKVTSRIPDVIDDHFYRKSQAMAEDVHHYDNYDRNGPKVFVGEWASQDVDKPWEQPETKGPTPTLNSALGDAAWLTGLERNADVVIMEAYAPLLVNVNPGGRQWGVNLIGYDTLTTYGSPAYWVQAMFGANHGDTILPVWVIGEAGGSNALMTVSATRDSKTGTIILKAVNTSAEKRTMRIVLAGVTTVTGNGTQIVLAGSGPMDTNTISDPNHIVPVTTPATGLSTNFFRDFPPYSVTVLKIPVK